MRSPLPRCAFSCPDVVIVALYRQLQNAIIEACRQLEDLQHSTAQQHRQTEEASQQLAALQAQRAAAAAEASAAQHQLTRVLRELEQCQQVTDATRECNEGYQ